jgi:hypothetical protein
MLALVSLVLGWGEIETTPSRDFPKELQAAAVTATVGVRNVTTEVDGSGALVGRRGPFVYILTAHHVVDRAERVQISVYSARSYPRADKVYRSAEVIASSPDCDLALLRLATRDALPDGLDICPAAQAPEGKDFPVLSVGGGPEAPTCSAEAVKDRRRVRKGTEEGATLCWETGGAPTAGRSGGPLLDRQGRLIGVCSGANDGKGYYAHLDEIHRFLKRNGMKSLLEGKPKP